MIGTELARLIDTRISDVERHAVRYRQGVVAGLNPLTVKLGGSDVAVQATRLADVGDLQAGDVVSVLSFDADLLVIGQVPTRNVFTALPAGPFHGQRITYQTAGMAADGVRWELEYNANSGSAYKWEFIGGTPLFSEVVTAESRNVASYGALTTAGPSITVPLAGDYLVEVRAGVNTGNATPVGAAMSYDIGGTGASDADAVWARPVAPGFNTSVARVRRKTGLAASTALVAKYKSPNAVSVVWGDRVMLVTPVRVG